MAKLNTMLHDYFKLLLFIFFISNCSFSQEMPIDFSDSSDTFSVWGGSTFSIRPSPTDSNNMVGEFFHSASASAQGHFLDLAKPIDLDVEKNITLLFYAFDPDSHTIGVKLENGDNADVQVDVTTSSQNNWTELTFDFSTVGGSGKYNRLTVIIDGGSSTPGTFLIDDINDGSVITDPYELDVIYSDLVWSDEFNTSGKNPVDATKWHHQTQLPPAGNGSWFNGEEQHYTNRIENSFVENGNLNIVAIKESFTDQGETKQYTSARLNSKFAFTYGRVDVRAKLPFGNGTWPAIWTLGKNVNEDGAYWDIQGFGTTTWPACGEIDIMEHGLGAVNHVSSALHTPCAGCSGNTMNTKSMALGDVANDFHVYSVNWSPNQITFLIDDVGYYTYNPSVKDASTWPFDLEQYLILNIAMGGLSGTIDPSFTQSPMVIDYVRVYQNTGLSVDENSLSDFKVFPNPTSGIINIKSKLNIDKIEVYDILGGLLIKKERPKNTLDISGLSSGVHLLYIHSALGITVKKIIRQ